MRAAFLELHELVVGEITQHGNPHAFGQGNALELQPQRCRRGRRLIGRWRRHAPIRIKQRPVEHRRQVRQGWRAEVCRAEIRQQTCGVGFRSGIKRSRAGRVGELQRDDKRQQPVDAEQELRKRGDGRRALHEASGM